jgi:hypothetical protein
MRINESIHVATVLCGYNGLKWATLIEPQRRMAGGQFLIRSEVENYDSHFISRDGRRDKNYEMINLYKELSHLIA